MIITDIEDGGLQNDSAEILQLPEGISTFDSGALGLPGEIVNVAIAAEDEKNKEKMDLYLGSITAIYR
ncbi:hypothetical protein KPL74_06750 [Bacillus sp. NP157]|nr:hypothetical protein KPL74_06750 [Bacillus sp. NP157]